VAGWSARHRKTAVFGWLLLVVVIFIAGQAIGSAQLPQYDAGQAEHVLNQVAPAARSTVASTSACRSTRAAAGQRRPGSVR
jgi:RND superfamily putative drug exporter